MTDLQPPSRPPNRPVARRRRANVARGRRVAYQVKLTEEEQTRLVGLAAAQEVTVPRLLVESALASVGETPTRRRQAMVELFVIRRLLAGVANNVNQLARLANISGEVPERIDAVLEDVRWVVGRIACWCTSPAPAGAMSMSSPGRRGSGDPGVAQRGAA